MGEKKALSEKNQGVSQGQWAMHANANDSHFRSKLYHPTMFLQLDRITLRYGGPASGKAAVQEASLALSAGQIGVLIGPSGCGKTSLLRAVAGLQALQGGAIRMAGQVLSQAAAAGHAAVHLPPEQRHIGMVFQDYALFPHLSVADNITFGLAHLPRAQRKARTQEVLDLVGLAHAASRAPQPQLLLLDEPFSSLDVDLRERLAQELRGILKAAQTTALFVTHDQMEAFALGDVIGVMHQGHLAQWDDAYTLYHRPASRFVASFIGHGVFAPGQIVSTQNGVATHTVVKTALGDLEDADECLLPTAYEGGLCDVLLRADDIVHDDAAPVQACIERKAFRGSEFLYTLRLPTGERVQAHVPSHHDHQVGEWIGIRAEVDHVVTFARERGL
jgi:iron(III) transport system ATP-binding protein